MKSLFSLLLLLAVCGTVAAQTGTARFLTFRSSARGNYLNLYPAGEDVATMQQTASFVIERVDWDTTGTSKDTVFRRVGEAKPVSSEKELRRIFSEPEITQLITVLKLGGVQELVQFFQAKKQPQDFSLFYKLLSVRMAMGHVFLDEKVAPGQIVLYRITRRDNSDAVTPWGKVIMVSKAGNYSLPYFKARNVESAITDSTAFFTWKMPVGDAVVSRVTRPRSPINGDEASVIYGLPDAGTDLIASVRLFVKGVPVEVKKMLPSLNAAGDTVSYYYTKSIVPEEEVSAFLVPQDEAGNEGTPSDTIVTYGVTQANAPLIYGVSVDEITDGIRLSWKPLPRKPYLAGILITRYDSKSRLDTVARLSPQDETFTDYQIAVGNQYTYNVSAQFLPGMGISQKIPAQGAGAYTQFSMPEKPQHLAAANEGRNIRLTWDSASSKSLYGYYIYRGTSRKKQDLVAGPVRRSTFLDTAASLSGRSTYYYTVMAQNLRQDTSDFSDYVSIRPLRAVNTTGPTNVEFYYTSGKLDVSWNDVRIWDDAVAGYRVEKRIKGEPKFQTLFIDTASLLHAEDSGLVRGTTYQYRVAALSITGDTSAYSEPAEFTLPLSAVDIVELFYLRNTSDGIALSIPAAEYAGRKAYHIYRRLAAGSEFSKIGTIPATEFAFTDKAAKLDETYVYTISVVAADDREGDKGAIKSIRRKAVKAATTL